MEANPRNDQISRLLWRYGVAMKTALPRDFESMVNKLEKVMSQPW
jgi:hypothetical protein